MTFFGGIRLTNTELREGTGVVYEDSSPSKTVSMRQEPRRQGTCLVETTHFHSSGGKTTIENDR